MRKEIILAIILGLILGGIIIYGAQLANRSAKEAGEAKPEASATPTETLALTPTPIPGLTIVAPVDHSVSFTATVKVSGTATPNADIIIVGTDNETKTTADSSGNFSATIGLSGGENILEVTSLSGDKTESSSTTIIYTTAKID